MFSHASWCGGNNIAIGARGFGFNPGLVKLQCRQKLDTALTFLSVWKMVPQLVVS